MTSREDHDIVPRRSRLKRELDAIRRKDYAEALDLLRMPAQCGDVLAQMTLAEMYYSGLAVPPQHDEAARWYRMAIDCGDESGISAASLGNIEAVKRARADAERGDAEAMHYLGLMYGSGIGAPRDLRLAQMWFLLAAKHGCDKGLSMLANDPESRPD